MYTSKTTDQMPYRWPTGTRSMFPSGDGIPLFDDPRDLADGKLSPILWRLRMTAMHPDTEMMQHYGDTPDKHAVRIWKMWLEGGHQEITDDPAIIAHATRVVSLLAMLHGIE